MDPDSFGRSWFDSLIPWQEFDQLWELLAEAEREAAIQKVMAALDYAVMNHIMSLLHQDHHHEFLELCHDRYHEPQILFWLEERVDGATDHVRTVIADTYQEIYAALV